MANDMHTVQAQMRASQERFSHKQRAKAQEAWKMATERMKDLDAVKVKAQVLVDQANAIQADFNASDKGYVEKLVGFLREAGIFDQFQKVEEERQVSRQAAEAKLGDVKVKLSDLDKIASFLQQQEQAAVVDVGTGTELPLDVSGEGGTVIPAEQPSAAIAQIGSAKAKKRR